VLSEDQAKFILGGQANVWTEYIKSFSEVEYMVYPRAIALMQSLWCTQKPSYDTFLRTYLTKHEDFLARRAVNFSRSVHLPKLKVERTSEGVAYSWTSIDSNQFFTLSSTLGNAVGGVSRLKNDEAVVFKPGTIDQRVTLSYGFAKDRQLNYHVHRSQALGAKVELLTEPHPKYNNNGSLNLVDGIQGSDRWKGDQWLGFRDTSISFIVDMDTVVDIERLTIGFLNKNGSWIYLPESVEIAVSSNGTDWEIVESIAIVEGNRIVRPEIVMDDTGRFIRVVVQPLNKIPNGNGGAGQVPWTFIDEIQVFTR
jgi:hexosaminidase